MRSKELLSPIQPEQTPESDPTYLTAEDIRDMSRFANARKYGDNTVTGLANYFEYSYEKQEDYVEKIYGITEEKSAAVEAAFNMLTKLESATTKGNFVQISNRVSFHNNEFTIVEREDFANRTQNLKALLRGGGLEQFDVTEGLTVASKMYSEFEFNRRGYDRPITPRKRMRHFSWGVGSVIAGSQIGFNGLSTVFAAGQISVPVIIGTTVLGFVAGMQGGKKLNKNAYEKRYDELMYKLNYYQIPETSINNPETQSLEMTRKRGFSVYATDNISDAFALMNTENTEEVSLFHTAIAEFRSLSDEYVKYSQQTENKAIGKAASAKQQTIQEAIDQRAEELCLQITTATGKAAAELKLREERQEKEAAVLATQHVLQMFSKKTFEAKDAEHLANPARQNMYDYAWLICSRMVEEYGIEDPSTQNIIRNDVKPIVADAVSLINNPDCGFSQDEILKNTFYALQDVWDNAGMKKLSYNEFMAMMGRKEPDSTLLAEWEQTTPSNGVVYTPAEPAK